MTDKLTQEAPALVGIGAQSIVERAKELGLTWTLRPATVTSIGSSLNPIEITYDGDTVSIGAVNLTGGALALADRVMGLILPPSGNFIIGSIEPIDPWHTPTLINSWVDYDATVWQGARYRKLSDGMVTIQGLVKNGTGPGPGTGNIFVLPPGYRPVKNLIFASIANNVFARIDVYPDGNVNWSTGGTNGFVTISVSFFADA